MYDSAIRIAQIYKETMITTDKCPNFLVLINLIIVALLDNLVSLVDSWWK